ncbi:hypothetical protein HPB47_020912 [Ixodes persulcatus]|uniref:Uncharacterized protein n=1 Tax=Ixodes persulcatus TaxID=34615 RepID=A0AC60QE97_IXOPE|nr:hypothetical protein HPB47_020912 [Ixodes persulcatus]
MYGALLTSSSPETSLCTRIHECYDSIKWKNMELFFMRRQLEHRLPEVFQALGTFPKDSTSTRSRTEEQGHAKKMASLQSDYSTSSLCGVDTRRVGMTNIGGIG